jgi:hypothetical protein
MAVFLSVDDEHKYVLTQFVGAVNDTVLFRSHERLRKWLADHGRHSGIADFSQVTSCEVTAQGVAMLASDAPLISESYLRIVVAPQDEVFGMARMYEMLGGATRSNRVHIVRTYEEARHLIGIGLLSFEPLLDW